MILTVVSFDLDWTSVIREPIVEGASVVSQNLATSVIIVVQQHPTFERLVPWYNTDDLPIPPPIQ